MLSARRRQWIAPDCWVGRVRNDGDDQPLHHLAGVYMCGKVLEGRRTYMRSRQVLSAGGESRRTSWWEVGGWWLRAGAGKPEVGGTMEWGRAKAVLYVHANQVSFLQMQGTAAPGWSGYADCHCEWWTGAEENWEQNRIPMPTRRA